MEKDSEQQAYIDQLLDSLSEEKISRVDFDHWKAWLRDTAVVLEEVENLREDLEAMRQDYIGRISGMMKAVAAVERSDSLLESTLEYLQELPALSGRELVRFYRKASARFRDAFPGSFGLSLSKYSPSARGKFPADYK
ncbi:MAG: hypothetical protein U9R56_01775 [candidate division Zixibacteria bacterium]|nr:hypothetical protein [candidate division Zixibacteria bacterium]